MYGTLQEGGLRNVIALVGSVLLLSTLSSAGSAQQKAGQLSSTVVADVETETPRQADSFVDTWGMNTKISYGGPSDPAVRDRELQELQQMGVRYIRDGGPSPHSDVLATLADLCAHGVRHTIGFGVKTTAQQIITAVERYKPECIVAVEPQNEYDGSKDPDWTTTLRAEQSLLYSTVKAQPRFSNITVLGPALARLSSEPLLGNIDSMMDAQNLHFATCDGNPLTRRYKTIDTVMQRYGYGASVKPTWTSETAYTDDPVSTCRVSEEVAGKLVLRTQFELFNRNEPHIFWYEFPDQPSDRMFGQQGFVEADGTPKPRYFAVKNIISLLADRGPSFSTKALHYELAGDTGDIHHTLLQKRDGRYFLALWREVESWDHSSHVRLDVPTTSVTVKLPRGTQSAKIYTFDDNYALKSKAVSTEGGRIHVAVADGVSIVSFSDE